MHKSLLQEKLQQIKCLKELSEINFNLLLDNVTQEKIAKNGFIYRKEDNRFFVYLVIKGRVKLHASINEDKEIIKDIIYDKSFFGENIFSANDTFLEDAICLEPTEIIKIPIFIFEHLVKNDTEFAYKIMEIIMNRVSTLDERIKCFVFNTAKNRIKNFIKRCATLRGIKIGLNEVLVYINLSHKEIASITDTSRQTVARVLCELKKENQIFFSPRKPSKVLLRQLIWE